MKSAWQQPPHSRCNRVLSLRSTSAFIIIFTAADVTLPNNSTIGLTQLESLLQNNDSVNPQSRRRVLLFAKKDSKSPVSFFPHRWGGMTPKFYPACKNNKADMSRWNSMPGLSPPASPPHKGHQSSAETAPSRGLSVSAWVEICVCVCVGIRWGGSRETRRRSRRGADWSVPGGRARWPSLAFDSSGQCPETRMSHIFFFFFLRPSPFFF